MSESERVRVWTIRLKPGERFGFHRHVLDYFWTAVSGGRGRQHLMDGSTVEYTYQPGETRHETYGPGEFKVHDLENTRRQGNGVHDRRVPQQRQQAAGDSAGGAHRSGLRFPSNDGRPEMRDGGTAPAARTQPLQNSLAAEQNDRAQLATQGLG